MWINRTRASVRSLVATLCVAVAWVPWAITWGGDFEHAAKAGQAFGQQQAEAVVLPSVSGNTMQLFPDQEDKGEISFEALFPGASSKDPATFSNLYGNDQALGASGANAQRDLIEDESTTGEAYQTLRDALHRERPRLRGDAMWEGTNYGELLGQYRDCKKKVIFHNESTPTEVSDLHDCDRYDAQRAMFRPDCEIDHPYVISPTGQVLSDGWEGEDLCINAGRSVKYGGCTKDSKVECTDMPELDANGCIPTSLLPVCAQQLQPSPVEGISSLCRKITVTGECSRAAGPMDCWTDAQGERQCPWNASGVETNCGEYESNPQCRKVASQCVDGAVNDKRQCYAWDETWDCRTVQDVPRLERETRIDCAGPVRCIGDDCVKLENERSEDFARAASALQSTQFAASDTECTEAGCVVFDGEHKECKRAVGGYVNCCETPDGVSLADYISLVFTIGKVHKAVMALDEANMVRGAWETLSGPITNTYSAVKESFASVANNIMGNTTATASKSALKGAVAAFKQALMREAAQWTANLFGEAAANTIFTATQAAGAAGAGAGAAASGGAAGGGAGAAAGAGAGTAATTGPAVVNGTVQTGTISFAPMIAAFFSIIMWAYLIYTIVTILIKIIWKCKKDEFTLGAQRVLKSYHKVGSYCRKKFLGACIEKRRTYCCFSTPLARIINEQIRPQLGRSWGSAKHPDCQGIDVADMQRVDWSQVDLSEWLSILKTTGHYPESKELTVEDLTGWGSDYDIGNTRADAEARTQQRIAPLDIEDINQKAEEELWNQTLQNVP